MSPEAIDRRMHEVSQLWKLGMKLRNAQRVRRVQQTEKANESEGR